MKATVSKTAPRLLRIEEIADLADTAQKFAKLADEGFVSIYQGIDAHGVPFRVTQDGTDGSGIFERLPLVDARAWA